MREPIPGTLKLLLTRPDRRYEQLVTLEPAHVVDLGTDGDRLIATRGWYQYDPKTGAASLINAEESGPKGRHYWGLYLQRGDSLYGLARKHARTAQELIAMGLPHYGEDLQRFVLRVDSAPLMEGK